MIARPDPFLESFASGFKLPPVLTVSQWADEYRWLSRKSTARHGKWSTDDVPYLKGIMDALSPSDPAQRVVVKKGSQVGGTEVGKNLLGFIAHQDPGPTLMVVPGLELARRISRQRIQPMIDETPVLRALFREAKSRDSGNTLLEKDFDGGSFTLTTARSVPGMKSAPIRYLILEEADEYDQDVDDQGSPITISEERTTTFEDRRKVFIPSTPRIVPGSLITTEYDNSDQRRYFVPCPRCGNMDWIRWENIIYQNNDARTARLRCVKCEYLMDEGQKAWILARENGAEWRPTATRAPLEGAPVPLAKDGVTAGFHIPGMLSTLGRTWAQLVEKHLDAKEEPKARKTFVQQGLGEAYEDRSEKVEKGALLERREEYEAEVPHGVGMLVSATDVHPDRLELAVYGFGAGEQSWAINKAVFHGDTAQDEVWLRMDAERSRAYEHASGRKVYVYYSVVDTGFRPERGYRYCRPRQAQRVFAVKGGGKRGDPIIAHIADRIGVYRARLYTYNADEARATLQGRLRIKEQGPGYVHFPKAAWCNQDFFDQLTARVGVWKEENGESWREWINVRERDEDFDLATMCIVGLHIGGAQALKSLPVLASTLSQPPDDEPAPESSAPAAPGWMDR